MTASPGTSTGVHPASTAVASPSTRAPVARRPLPVSRSVIDAAVPKPPGPSPSSSRQSPDSDHISPAAEDSGTALVTADAADAERGRSIRGPAVVAGTVGVVLLEFALLHLVHQAVPSILYADLIYAALLVVASVGWMNWFQRLVARHRTLERSLTEQQARAIGAQRLAALVRGSADAILVSDASGAITYASPSVLGVLGLCPREVEGRCFADLVDADERDGFALVVGLLDPGDETPLHTRMRHADGRSINIEGNASNLLDDPAVNGVVYTVRDVTERVRLAAALSRQAFQDSLTGLANRQLFSDRLAHALQTYDADRDQLVVVLYCDLDEFKMINDSRGHGAGDRVLIESARRALDAVRPGDTVARLGGDEFAVLLPDTDFDTALEVSERLRSSLNSPIELDGETVPLGSSIGIATSAAGATSAEEMLRNADVAMYLAKGRGKGTVAVYDAELHAEALRKIDVRLALYDAIRNGEIRPAYQPIVELRSGQVAGYEALARWTRPDGRSVSPGDFVPVAEQCGAIHELGRQILEVACADTVEFSRIAGRPITMSVNTTVRQLSRSDYVEEVLQTLASAGLPATQLVLEITESELVRELAFVEKQLSELRSHGIRIAIDDFGTGFSSLAYLRTLPVDTLKVDKAFIDDVTDDAHGSALARAIVALSTSVELTTVAEGVETEEQARWLAATDCRYAQGFLWSRAVPAEDVRAMLRGA